jgi:hypothetical protein
VLPLLCGRCLISSGTIHPLFLKYILGARIGVPLTGCLKTVFPQPVDQEVEFYSFCINILPNIVTLWYTIYDIYQLLHVLAQRCYPQGVIIQRYISQHASLCSVPPIQMTKIFKC